MIAAGAIGLIVIAAMTGVSLVPVLLDLPVPVGVAVAVIAFAGGGVLLAAVCLLLRLGPAVWVSTILVAYLIEVVLMRAAREPAEAIVIFGVFGYQVLPLAIGAAALHAIHEHKQRKSRQLDP